jgi:hypothetical protein
MSIWIGGGVPGIGISGVEAHGRWRDLRQVTQWFGLYEYVVCFVVDISTRSCTGAMQTHFVRSVVCLVGSSHIEAIPTGNESTFPGHQYVTTNTLFWRQLLLVPSRRRRRLNTIHLANKNLLAMRLLTSTLALPLIALIPEALAWGAAGHEIIATIAQIHLHPHVRQKLCTLLPPEAHCHLAPVAAWADQVRGHYPGTAPMHYINGKRLFLRRMKS